MNLKWTQYWIGLFGDRTDELMSLYSDKYQFEDVNFDLRVNNDLPALRQVLLRFRDQGSWGGLTRIPDTAEWLDSLFARRARTTCVCATSCARPMPSACSARAAS